jgi:hypothetical protein
MSVRNQLENECQKEVNNELNISTKSIIDNKRKAVAIDTRSVSGVNFLSNTVDDIENTRR